jgi:hypothetical protein
MKDEDEQLKGFFRAMKQSDERLPVPEFALPGDSSPQKKMPLWPVLVAAANISVFIGGFWYWSLQSPQTANLQASPTPLDETDMMTWTTPTDQLLTDF